MSSMIPPLTAGSRMAAGGGSVSNWRLVKMSGRPSSPATILARARTWSGSCRRISPTWSRTPARSTAARIASVSARSSASGFSHRMSQPARRGGLDDRAMVDRRDRDQHRVDARRADRVERVRERRGPADLVGQPAGRRPVDVTDRHDPQLGCARGDEPGMVAPHPPGADERQPDPRRQWISSIRTDRASRSDVVAAIAIRVAS